MAITTPPGPADAPAALNAGLRFLVGRPSGPVAQGLRGRGYSVDELTYASPFQTYAIAPGDLAAGRFLDAAAPRAWTYWVVHSAPAPGGGAAPLAPEYLPVTSASDAAREVVFDHEWSFDWLGFASSARVRVASDVE